MNHKCNVLLVIIILFTKQIIHAQLKPVTVGDMMPNLSLKVFNTNSKSTSTIQFSDLKGDGVILDFWATWCGSCLEKMEGIAQLQNKYSGTVRLFLVSYQPKDVINTFFRKRKDLAALGLSIIYDTKDLHKLFPHKAIPHVVWIDKNRKVKAITEASYVTDTNVSDLISKRIFQLPLKQDAIDFDFDTQLSINTNYATPHILYNSFFGENIPDVGGRISSGKFNEKSYRICAVNIFWKNLYSFAYRYKISNLNNTNPTSRIVVEGNDSTNDITRISFLDSLNSKFYCYELIMPFTSNNLHHEKAYSYMQIDLDRFFNITSSVEKRKVNCFVISASNKILKPSTDTSYIDEYFDYAEVVNQSIYDITELIKAYFNSDIPIICENKDVKVTLMLKRKYDSVEELKKDLEKVGLDISMKKEEIELLVLRNL